MSFFDSGSSVKFENPNDSFTGTITGFHEEQRNDFTTKQPATWKDGSPKMQMVVSLDDAANGEPRKLYIPKGRLQKAVGAALRAVGHRELQVGGVLTVTFTGFGQASKPGFLAPKEFMASYQPAGAAVPVAQAPQAPAQPVAQPQYAGGTMAQPAVAQQQVPAGYAPATQQQYGQVATQAPQYAQPAYDPSDPWGPVAAYAGQ